MKGLRIGSLALVVLAMSHAAAAEQQKKTSPGCEKIVAALDEAGGKLSAEEIARKTASDIETVRKCTDQWRSTMRDKGAPAGDKAPQLPPECVKVISVIDNASGRLSADKVAKESGADVKTVNKCAELWGRSLEK